MTDIPSDAFPPAGTPEESWELLLHSSIRCGVAQITGTALAAVYNISTPIADFLDGNP
ncbi:hypothetical protein DEU56DRAFT_912793 [Suillus clintonianus]|uniref:uncharacterized protein n=1 Tax=Suillus clintonianus TaxID=1904413 RepID=UPI001B86405C|nr:uncharacterized protein DEU56DRAFT_912793 [Suillus clintonianus]KAG2137022.1 hypothetical protein DEU56DRAFT_912793 [Suillus clintonianus]